MKVNFGRWNKSKNTQHKLKLNDRLILINYIDHFDLKNKIKG